MPTPVIFNGPGDAVIGVIAREIPGTSYGPAAIGQTASQGRSWFGSYSASPPPNPPTLPPDNWFLIDSYFPGNWMIRASGQSIVPTRVLVVNDNGATTSSTLAFTTALTNLGVAYDVVSSSSGTGIPATMTDYSAVLYAGTPSAGPEADQLMAYLDAGGRLLVADNDFGYSMNSATIYTQYFQAAYISDAGSDGPIVGADIMAGINLDISTDPYPDSFSLGADAVGIFANTAPRSQWAGSRIERNGYRAIYLAWDFQYAGGSTVGDQVETDIVEAALAWLVPPEPDIDVSPLSLSALQPIDTTTQQTLTIGNAGEADLEWEILEESADAASSLPAAVCDNPADVPWLSVDPDNGTTVPGDNATVDVTFDSTGLAVGTYNANLCIASNDPDNGTGNGTKLVIVPVSMDVEGCVTDADCYDGIFCNGPEQCEAGECVPGEPPFCPSDAPVCDERITGCVGCLDNSNCSGDTPVCDEENAICIGCLDASDCADDLYCNGVETCVDGACVDGTSPCAEGQTCDEETDACVDPPECTTDANCDDGLYCNGEETCVAGTCVEGVNPCPADLPVCDEPANACVECLVDADCAEDELCAENMCIPRCEINVSHKRIRSEKLTGSRKAMLNITSEDRELSTDSQLELAPFTPDRVKYNQKKKLLKIRATVPAGLAPGVYPIRVDGCLGDVVVE